MYYGFDMGGTKIEFGAFDAQHNRLIQKRVATPRDDYQALLDVIVQLTLDADAELGCQGMIGIGIPECLIVKPARCLLPTFRQPWANR
ncbi:N-acetyl-D-glucosamine kinase [Budvicia aquatica]|uniref:N-acetyl-D-glucosamine kinase n=1 Tax=Budvicia aquatica TaxID=82979 RepID=A0A484ZSJ6_9GAMM|nr:N-acetyl-D-glucosamine kinase [Budvicia aquatica]